MTTPQLPQDRFCECGCGEITPRFAYSRPAEGVFRGHPLADAIRKGRMAYGTRHYKTKLTEDDVVAIRTAYAAGQPSRDLGARYGLKGTEIREITRGRFFASLPGPITVRPHRNPCRHAAEAK